MKYNIANLNLSNNTKVSQGFIDSLGVSDLVNVQFEVDSISINATTKTLTIGVIFESNNFKQHRSFDFTSADLSANAKAKLQDLLDDAETFLINQAEFTSATPV